jgi:hypothetical protein
MARLLGLVTAALLLVVAPAPPRAGAGQAPASATVRASWFGATPPLAPGQIELAVVSSLPATVTGEDARIEVRGALPGDAVRLDRDGTDATASLHPAGGAAGSTGVLTGVVAGLRVGVNHLTATVTGDAGTRRATLTLTDHPVTGPVISGPHQTPFLCETEAAGMGRALDADCSARPRVDWYARSTTGRFAPLADPYAPYPPDTATTTTSDGKTVPFVVRVESSTINRSITRVAVLDDPAGRGRDKPYAPSTAWNRRFIYSFGESCGPGHHQGVNLPDNALGQVSSGGNPYDNAFAPFLDLPSQLGKGYLTAHSTLTILGVECNDVVSAETLMMVKEHVIEAYGTVVHTIGAGASGGAIQQYTAADNYPGLIDGGTPIISFPDMTTTLMTIGDCLLLDRVFDADPLRWTEPKREAVTGFRTSRLCADWDSSYASLFNPKACDPSVPAAQVYDATRNRGGVRCTFQDDQVNLWGRDPKTGFARRPLDNTGVQYGLNALRSGLITTADFVALNGAVGGLDIDGNATPRRMDMGADVAQTAYSTGRITGRGALVDTPIIDNHPNLDLVPVVDVHDAARPFMLRARLDARLGRGTQSLWQGAPYPSDGFAPMEQWLTTLEAKGQGPANGSRAAAVAAARPASASDRCTLPFGVGIDGTAPCDAVVDASPRIAAGGPRSEDVIKCALEPVAAADYPGVSAADLVILRRTFPTGVCNWASPGAGGTTTTPAWLSFGDGSGALPPVPVPLTNVVARSAPPGGAVLGASTTRGGGRSGLPPTGGRSAAAVGLALAGAGLAMRYGHSRAHARRHARRR